MILNERKKKKRVSGKSFLPSLRRGEGCCVATLGALVITLRACVLTGSLLVVASLRHPQHTVFRCQQCCLSHACGEQTTLECICSACNWLPTFTGQQALLACRRNCYCTSATFYPVHLNSHCPALVYRHVFSLQNVGHACVYISRSARPHQVLLWLLA